MQRIALARCNASKGEHVQELALQSATSSLRDASTLKSHPRKRVFMLFSCVHFVRGALEFRP